jgi:hypothetical protein
MISKACRKKENAKNIRKIKRKRITKEIYSIRGEIFG